MTMTFSNYGAPMPRFSATLCAGEASRDVVDEHAGDMDHVVGERELVYRHRNVVLTVFPRPPMTWRMVCGMVGLVIEFITDYDPMSFEFDVEVFGVMGLVASGNMTAL